MRIRGLTKADYDYIISVLDQWWGGPAGRRADPMFFYEFGEHALVAELDGIAVTHGPGLVGSLLVGDGDLLTEARRIRKMFGGGMRQAGVIAATQSGSVQFRIEIVHQGAHGARVLREGGARGIQSGMELGHGGIRSVSGQRGSQWSVRP